MLTVDIDEAGNNFFNLIQQIKNSGDQILITDNGLAVATLKSYSSHKIKAAIRSIEAIGKANKRRLNKKAFETILKSR